MFKMLIVTSSFRFPDQFASSINILQNTNLKISNLRLAVLIKVILVKKKVYIVFFRGKKQDNKTVRYLTKHFVSVRYLTIEFFS